MIREIRETANDAKEKIKKEQKPKDFLLIKPNGDITFEEAKAFFDHLFQK